MVTLTRGCGAGAPGLHPAALGLVPPSSCQEVLWPLPIYLLVPADCYALGTVGYRMANFHGCEDAALELQNQIQDPGTDLTCEGMCSQHPNSILTWTACSSIPDLSASIFSGVSIRVYVLFEFFPINIVFYKKRAFEE